MIPGLSRSNKEPALSPSRLALVVSLSACSLSLPATAQTVACTAAMAEPVNFAQIMPNLDLRLTDGQILRLVGLAPLYSNPPAQQDFAERLSAELRTQTVLAQVTGAPDRWGRRPALVFFEDRSQALVPLAKAILQTGGARFKPDAEAAPCRAPFLDAEREARESHAGLWRDGALSLYPADLHGIWTGLDGHFVIVEGQARHYGLSRSRAYLDFSQESGQERGFSIHILKKNLKNFESHGLSLANLPGHRIRVRGVLDLRFAPRMEVISPDALEIDP